MGPADIYIYIYIYIDEASLAPTEPFFEAVDDDDCHEDLDVVGCRVRREYGGTAFMGTVSMRWVDGNDVVFRITHDDGDVEDVTMDELSPCIVQSNVSR